MDGLGVGSIDKGLPAIFPYRAAAERGALMAYAADTIEQARYAADAIGAILKGAKPGEISFYQPSTFVLVINLKTAKALGLAIPPSLLARADEVIE
jgi:putative ABC transport system substrate-binding protein